MSYSNYDSKYLASRPARLHFAGWETDTYRLQQNGWQLSASQDPRYNRVQLAFSHQEYQIRGVSDYINADNRYAQFVDMPEVIDVRAHLASDFIMRSVSTLPFNGFTPIDAEPQWVDSHQYMSKHMLFAPNLARTQEIIVPEQSVDDLLNMMLDKQASNRAELIRRRVREEGQRVDFNARSHVHAQIISIAA